MKNTDLKQTYNQMHSTGKSAWFDDGKLERKAILDMGAPWQGKTVIEIGCGEGELLDMIDAAHAVTSGIDYSLEAITTAKNRFPHLDVMCCAWEEYPHSRNDTVDVLVMQGVLEHMDDWRQSLSDMISRFQPKTVITSMPAFINIRGIIWHTLDMLGAVMSKTDLHYIDIWEVEQFCVQRNYWIMKDTIDWDWGNGPKMIDDLMERIPLAIKDGGIPWDAVMFGKFMAWLGRAMEYFDHDEGAINIYRIDL